MQGTKTQCRAARQRAILAQGSQGGHLGLPLRSIGPQGLQPLQSSCRSIDSQNGTYRGTLRRGQPNVDSTKQRSACCGSEAGFEGAQAGMMISKAPVRHVPALPLSLAACPPAVTWCTVDSESSPWSSTWGMVPIDGVDWCVKVYISPESTQQTLSPDTQTARDRCSHMHRAIAALPCCISGLARPAPTEAALPLGFRVCPYLYCLDWPAVQVCVVRAHTTAKGQLHSSTACRGTGSGMAWQSR